MAHEKKDSSAGIHVGETIHPSEEIKSPVSYTHLTLPTN